VHNLLYPCCAALWARHHKNVSRPRSVQEGEVLLHATQGEGLVCTQTQISLRQQTLRVGSKLEVETLYTALFRLKPAQAVSELLYCPCCRLSLLYWHFESIPKNSNPKPQTLNLGMRPGVAVREGRPLPYTPPPSTHAHAPHVHVHSGPLVSFASDQASCLRRGH